MPDIHMSAEEYRRMISGEVAERSMTPGSKPDKQETVSGVQIPPSPHKYRNVTSEYLGMRFDSKKEAKIACELEMKKRSGEILTWIRQVSFSLPGGVKHRVDFMVINLDKTVRFIEAKGRDLPIGKLKRKQVEEIHGIKIEVV